VVYTGATGCATARGRKTDRPTVSRRDLGGRAYKSRIEHPRPAGVRVDTGRGLGVSTGRQRGPGRPACRERIPCQRAGLQLQRASVAVARPACGALSKAAGLGQPGQGPVRVTEPAARRRLPVTPGGACASAQVSKAGAIIRALNFRFQFLRPVPPTSPRKLRAAGVLAYSDLEKTRWSLAQPTRAPRSARAAAVPRPGSGSVPDLSPRGGWLQAHPAAAGIRRGFGAGPVQRAEQAQVVVVRGSRGRRGKRQPGRGRQIRPYLEKPRSRFVEINGPGEIVDVEDGGCVRTRRTGPGQDPVRQVPA